MYDVYLFHILFPWFLLTQILMINKIFTKGHTIFLERMTNQLGIKNSHGRFWNLGEKSRILWNFLFHAKNRFEWVVESPRRTEELVEYSRIYGLGLYLAYNILVVSCLFWSFLKEYYI